MDPLVPPLPPPNISQGVRRCEALINRAPREFAEAIHVVVINNGNFAKGPSCCKSLDRLSCMDETLDSSWKGDAKLVVPDTEILDGIPIERVQPLRDEAVEQFSRADRPQGRLSLLL